MKRPSGRSTGKQVHRCVLCGSQSHRLETCTLPGAEEFRKMRKSVSYLKRQSESKKVLRVQTKNRKTPQKNSTFRLDAKKIYSGNNVPSASSRPNQQRLKKNVDALTWKSDEDALSWLESTGFFTCPGQCSSCKKWNMLGPYFESGRAAHFRCTPCGTRAPWLAHTDWHGLRCSPLQLANLLSVYSRLDITKAASVADLVQFAQCGRCQERNLTDVFLFSPCFAI